MPKLKKILLLAGKIILGIFLLYIIICIAVLPLFGPMVAKSQVKKLTGQDLKVKLMVLNPFTWKLSLNGLQLFDENDQLLAGFDKFWVDVSFLGLLKKKYHIESVGLTGLEVNVVLNADGSINLLKLVPEKKEDNAIVSDKQEQNSAPADAAKTALPDLLVSLISMEQGKIRFTDNSVFPGFSTELGNMDLRVENLTNAPDVKAKISFKALLDDKAVIVNEALLNPFAAPLSMEMVFKLNDYAMDILTPYVGKYTGRQAKSGRMDIKIEYRITDDQLDAKHKVKIQGFDFGDKVESSQALKLPFSMVLALLEDSEDKIMINLPVKGDINDPEFHYMHMLGQVAKNFFMKIVTKPFTALVSMAGSGSSSEEYGYIGFAPGSAEITEQEKEKIAAIVKAFNQRPKIVLKIKKCYDPVSDWRKIKTDVFENDFNALKAETERSDDYVYERLYDRRFGMRAFWNLTNRFTLKNRVYDFENIRREVRRRLIEDGVPDKDALEKLAQSRAEAISAQMSFAGLDQDRIVIDDFEQNQILGEEVPVTLELRIAEGAEAKEQALAE